MACSVYIVFPSVLSYSNLKLHQTLQVKNIFKQEKNNPAVNLLSRVNVNRLSNKLAQKTNIIFIKLLSKDAEFNIVNCF